MHYSSCRSVSTVQICHLKFIIYETYIRNLIRICKEIRLDKIRGIYNAYYERTVDSYRVEG